MITNSTNNLTIAPKTTHLKPSFKVKNLLWGCVGIGCALVAAKLTTDFMQSSNPINPNPLNETNATQPVCLPSEKIITTNLAPLFCLPSEGNTTIQLTQPSFTPLSYTNTTQPACLLSDKEISTISTPPLFSKLGDKNIRLQSASFKQISLKLSTFYGLVHNRLKALSSMINDIFFNENCSTERLTEKYNQLLNISDSNDEPFIEKITCGYEGASYSGINNEISRTKGNSYTLSIRRIKDVTNTIYGSSLLTLYCGRTIDSQSSDSTEFCSITKYNFNQYLSPFFNERYLNQELSSQYISKTKSNQDALFQSFLKKFGMGSTDTDFVLLLSTKDDYHQTYTTKQIPNVSKANLTQYLDTVAKPHMLSQISSLVKKAANQTLSLSQG